MKTFKIPLLTATLSVWLGLTFSACDDRFGDELRSIGHRVEVLEDSLLQINNDMELLREVLVTIQKNGFVTDITHLPDGTYSITFNDGRTVVLRDGLIGADGRDGEDGTSESLNISVQMGEDGRWYWTLNGEWLLDNDGNVMPVTGEDGKDGRDGEDGKDGRDGQDDRKKNDRCS